MTLISKLLPLILLVLLGLIATVVAYAIYSVYTEVANKTQQKMEEKNVSFSKDGMKVGVKGVGNENYVDRTQRYAMLLNSFLGYTDGRRFVGDRERNVGERRLIHVCVLCSLLVKAWNYSSLPGYKGGFWNNEQQQGAAARKP